VSDDDGLQVAEITVTRRFYVTDDPTESDQISVSWSDGMTLIDALGLLRFAEMSVIEDFNTPEEE
jgi:hypothetical protein